MGLSLDTIERLFWVEPETGEIYGRMDPSRPLGWIKPGSPATGGGYRMIAVWVDGKRRQVRAHHIVWAWAYGEWPEGFEIDHEDGNRDNNAIGNLRRASVSDNRTNKRVQSNNKTGLKWVYRDRNAWRVDVGFRDENNEFKRFRVNGIATSDAAYEMASSFAKSAHGTFYNPGKR